MTMMVFNMQNLFYVSRSTLCVLTIAHSRILDRNRTLIYDLSALSSVGSILNGPSFTSKGTKYYHQFNISLCGAEVLSHTHISSFS